MKNTEKQIVQYVVQTENRKTKWGSEGYYKNKEDAEKTYKALKQDKSLRVRMWKETILLGTIQKEAL